MMIRSLIVLAFAYTPCVSACCMADKFEIVQSIVEGYSIDSVNGIYEAKFDVSYDATKKIVNLDGFSVNNGKRSAVRMIQDYGNTGSLFTIDKATQKCTKSILSGNFTAPCIPADSPKIESLHYGLPTTNFDSDVYEMPSAHFPGLTSYTSVTREGCIRMGESVVGSYQGSKNTTNIITMTIGYSNYSAGIKDPSVFVIPDICKQAVKNFESKTLPHAMGGHILHP